MVDKGELLSELYQARFDGLKEVAVAYNLPKTGSVETLRARLIQNLIPVSYTHLTLPTKA